MRHLLNTYVQADPAPIWATSEPVRELNESLESLVIQGRRPESLGEVADVEQGKPRTL